MMKRRHYDNLILLCDEHHCIIDNMDNEGKYPVSLLNEWKMNHEDKLKHEKLTKKPRLLNIAINAIANIDFEISEEKEIALRAFKIEDKIFYNAVKRNIFLIDD